MGDPPFHDHSGVLKVVEVGEGLGLRSESKVRQKLRREMAATKKKTRRSKETEMTEATAGGGFQFCSHLPHQPVPPPAARPDVAKPCRLAVGAEGARRRSHLDGGHALLSYRAVGAVVRGLVKRAN